MTITYVCQVGDDGVCMGQVCVCVFVCVVCMCGVGCGVCVCLGEGAGGDIHDMEYHVSLSPNEHLQNFCKTKCKFFMIKKMIRSGQNFAYEYATVVARWNSGPGRSIIIKLTELL